MTYLECAYLKVGDRLTITEEPPLWEFYNRDDKPKYPYTFTVEDIYVIGYADAPYYTPHLSIRDTNGYCWAINRKTHKLFEKNNTLNDRKSRIENLNV